MHLHISFKFIKFGTCTIIQMEFLSLMHEQSLICLIKNDKYIYAMGRNNLILREIFEETKVETNLLATTSSGLEQLIQGVSLAMGW